MVDNERVSNLLIDEFRAGKIGKLTIDRLPNAGKPAPKAETKAEKPAAAEETPDSAAEPTATAEPAEGTEAAAQQEDRHAEL
jgi:hypothetical protein